MIVGIEGLWQQAVGHGWVSKRRSEQGRAFAPEKYAGLDVHCRVCIQT